MKKFAHFIKKIFKENSFLKSYTLILMPVLVICVFWGVSSYSYNKNYSDLIKQSYLSSLQSIASENESLLQNVASLVTTMMDTDVTKKDYSDPDAYFNNVVKTLTTIEKNNNLIDSLFVFNRSDSTVYTKNGSYSAESFFLNNYSYVEYSKNYFEIYSSIISHMRILPPSSVKTPVSEFTVIPIVFNKRNPSSFNELIVVNINLSKVLNEFNDTKLTKNTLFFFLNKQTNKIFYNENSLDFIPGEDFYDNIYQGLVSTFDYDFNGEKSLILSHSPTNSILGYSYVACVPYSDINIAISNVTYFIAVLAFVTLLIAFIVAYFSTKRIYKPIEHLASLFGEKNPSDKDALHKLHISIQETLESNTNLSNEISKALPLIQERYLINFLNSNEYHVPEEELPIDFKYENFCSIVVKLRPTDLFFTSFSNVEYTTIKSGIYNIIQSSFADRFETYIIPSEADTLYVLLNLDKNVLMSEIVEVLEEFQNAMEFDKEYMTLKIGIGGIYPQLSGLKNSHHEAVNSISSYIGLTHLKLYDENAEKSTTFILNMNDENAFLNHLILGRSDEAKAVVDTVLKNNVSNNISNTALIQLYIQLLNITFKVMRMKNIAYDVDNQGDFHIITEIINQPVPAIHDMLMEYINAIVLHIGNASTKVDIQSVIDYMEKNYNKDIGLEIIADNFKTTPKYLSKLIKDKLGVNFVDYLAGLRINAAKILLCETNKSITEIFEEVGFNNRNTFIRCFKKITGLTPTEFKKSEKK